VIAHLKAPADASGNSDHNSAIAPVTKGVATLVPSNVAGRPIKSF
jgi:hypothetical protein